MELLSLTLTGDPALVQITVTSMSDTIDIKGYSQQSQLRVRVTWTAVPTGHTIETASLFMKASEDDAGNILQVDITTTTDIDTVGQITNAGSSGTAVMDFIVDATVLTAGQAYFDYVQMIDDTGYSRTWEGLARFLEAA